MKSETDTIIAELLILADAFKGHNQMVVQCLGGAAGRLEELQRENKNTLVDLVRAIEQRDDSYAEIKTVRKQWSESVRKRDKTVADLIKQRDEAIASARQEPSRLEIAAMLKAGWFANPDALTRHDKDPKWWIEQADELIATAKEAK